MKVFYLKLRANIELDGDLQLAAREINALFGKSIALHRETIVEAQNYLDLSEDFFLSHTRNGEVIGYLGINPKVELTELLKQLSFIQEIWFSDEGLTSEKFEYLTQAENFVCAVPFLALAEFLTYSKTETPDSQLVKTILDVVSLKLSDKTISQLILRRNTSTPHVHGLHTYKAKFFPRFVRSLIVSETALENRNNQIILDPFLGSGTTVVEASLLGFQSIGIDIDKLSCLISESKINLLNNSFEAVQKSAIQFYSNGNKPNGEYIFPSWISRKFERHNILDEKRNYETEISNWLAKLHHVTENKALFQIAVSDALTRKFNIRMMGTGVGRFALEIQKSEISSIIEKNLKYILKSAKIIEVLSRIYRIEIVKPQILNDSAIKQPIETETVDFIITSPPYLPASSGREDYLIGKSISLTALNLMNETAIQNAEKKSVGSMKNLTGARNGLPDSVYQLHDWLKKDELRNIKAQPTLVYYQDLKKSLKECFRVLKKGGKAIFIIGKETVFYSYKTREILFRVACDEIFKQIANLIGFHIVETVDIELDKKNKNARPRSLDKYFETVIVLKKT
jgi:DNA modification methylase